MDGKVEKRNAYIHHFRGGIENLYTFVTDNKVSYDVKFKPSDYILENRTPFYVPAFELIIRVASNPNEKKSPLDPKIAGTVATIFDDFFNNNNEQVVIYICDSSDAREEARRRKFNQWVEYFKGNEYLKVDTKIIDPLGPIYYSSIILRTNNSYRNQVIQAFIDLADENQK